MRKKFCPLIFSLVKIAANTSAKANVIIVTTTISRIVFCIERIKLASLISLLKFSRPTKSSVVEYALRLNRDILNTLIVGIIIKTVNRITAGAAHRKINPLRPDRFFIDPTPPLHFFVCVRIFRTSWDTLISLFF